MSLLFDANTDAVTCGDVDIEGATALTAAVIAHPTSVGGGGAVRAYMVKKEAIALQDEGLGSTRFYVTSGGASLSYQVNLGGGGIAITAGQSYHIVARWRASDQTLKIQINGVDQPLTQVDVGSPASIANTTYNWSIGYNADWGTNSVQGQMQDSSLAASYFSDADALALWNGGGTQSGTCQAADATHITLAAGASSSDDTYNGWFITAGGETYIITDYVGSTRVATISGTWAATPTGGVTTYVANKAKSMEHFSAKAILRMGSTADLTDYTNNGWNGTNSGTTNGSFAATLDYPAAVPPDPPTYSSGTLAGLPAGTEGDLSSITLGTHSSGDGTPSHAFTVKDADGNVISGATFTMVWSDDVDFIGAVGDITLTGRGTVGATITVDVAADTFEATNINGSTGNDAVNDASVTNGSAVYWLTTGEVHEVVVRAVIGGDESANSNADTFTIGSTDLTEGLLSETTHDHNSATIQWTSGTGGTGTISEQLQQYDGATWNNVVGETASPAAFSGLTPETTYFYRVRYTDETPDTVYSNTLVVETDAEPVPAAPTGLVLTAIPGGFRAVWDAVSGATSYKLKYGTSTGVYTVTLSGISGLITTVGDLAIDEYFVVVLARNSGGDSDPSAESSIEVTEARASGGWRGRGRRGRER